MSRSLEIWLSGLDGACYCWQRCPLRSGFCFKVAQAHPASRDAEGGITNVGAPQTGILSDRQRTLIHSHRAWIIAGAALVAILVCAGSLLAAYWPYRYSKIKPKLEETFGSQITIGKYERTYFPNPGFVIDVA